MRRAWWACALLCGALSSGCSTSGGGTGGTSPGTDAGSLVGTWNLTTTPPGASAVVSTVTLGQDSLDIRSPDFTLTATRTGSALSFADDQGPGDTAVLTATQTAGTFDAGLVPFELSGHWTMQAGQMGESPAVTCTLDVSTTEIDGACQMVSPAGPWFSFTTKKTNAAASSFGDLGGSWLNTWIWPGASGGTFPCTLAFTGNDIATCAGGAVQGEITGNPLSGITFTYDGANTVSGAAQGWAEFSATR